jgi:hypothetical protein
MSTNVTKFIAELAAHFPPRHPKGSDTEKAWLQSMVRELKGYRATELDNAARRIIQTRKRTDFPLLADCKAACDEAKKWLDLQEAKLPTGAQHSKPEDIYSAERVRLADELIVGPMGRAAVEGNWILALHDFIRINRRLPDQGEVKRIRSGGRPFRGKFQTFEEAYAECVRGEWPQAKKLLELGDKMLKRRAELADRVNNGVIGG